MASRMVIVWSRRARRVCAMATRSCWPAAEAMVDVAAAAVDAEIGVDRAPRIPSPQVSRWSGSARHRASPPLARTSAILEAAPVRRLPGLAPRHARGALSLSKGGARDPKLAARIPDPESQVPAPKAVAAGAAAGNLLPAHRRQDPTLSDVLYWRPSGRPRLIESIHEHSTLSDSTAGHDVHAQRGHRPAGRDLVDQTSGRLDAGVHRAGHHDQYELRERRPPRDRGADHPPHRAIGE